MNCFKYQAKAVPPRLQSSHDKRSLDAARCHRPVIEAGNTRAYFFIEKACVADI